MFFTEDITEFIKIKKKKKHLGVAKMVYVRSYIQPPFTLSIHYPNNVRSWRNVISQSITIQFGLKKYMVHL